MNVYYACKRCDHLPLQEKHMYEHYITSHRHLSYSSFKDIYIDFTKPLYKCKYCTNKLSITQLRKHIKTHKEYEKNDSKLLKLALQNEDKKNNDGPETNKSSENLPNIDLENFIPFYTIIAREQQIEKLPIKSATLEIEPDDDFGYELVLSTF